MIHTETTWLCPQFITIGDAEARVILRPEWTQDELSKLVHITNGTKQCCVLHPTLDSIFLSMILKQAADVLDDDERVYVWHRLDGCHYNHRHLQNLTMLQEWLVKGLLSAEDVDLDVHTEQAFQRITSCFAYSSRPNGLEGSLRKTEVV